MGIIYPLIYQQNDRLYEICCLGFFRRWVLGDESTSSQMANQNAQAENNAKSTGIQPSWTPLPGKMIHFLFCASE